jgi:hypothetical protein
MLGSRSLKTKLWAAVVTLLLCGSAAYPVLLPAWQDSFPLSTYPMFADRPGRLKLSRLEAVLQNGQRLIVPPRAFGSGEELEASIQVEQAVRSGRAAMTYLCFNVAEKLARGGLSVELLEAVRVVFDPIEYLESGPRPIEQKVLSRCRLAMPPEAARP